MFAYLCTNALAAASNLHSCLGADLAEYSPPHPGWVGQVISGVLQVADQLLLPQAQPPAAAPSSSQRGSRVNSSSSSSTCGNDWGQERVAVSMMGLLSESLQVFLCPSFSSSGANLAPSSTHCSTATASACGVAAVSALPMPDLNLAEGIATLCTATEAGLHANHGIAARHTPSPPLTD